MDAKDKGIAEIKKVIYLLLMYHAIQFWSGVYGVFTYNMYIPVYTIQCQENFGAWLI